jgi:hypothetical protein
VRTFPRELAELRRRVAARTAELRRLPRAALVAAGSRPAERIDVQGRAATLGVSVRPQEGGSLRVIVEGRMPCRVLPFFDNVDFDGFTMRTDGVVEGLDLDE